MSSLSDSKFAYEVPGKLEIPYRYMAGKTGSRFLTGLRDEKKIRGTRCPHCQTVFVPPRSLCDKCYKRIEDEVEVGPAGTVTSFTVVRYWEPHLPMKPPYILALIQLDRADTALAHLVSGIAPEAMKIGLRVEAVWAEERKARITDIAYFKPVLSERMKPLKQAVESAGREAGSKAKAAAQKMKQAVKKVAAESRPKAKKAVAKAGKKVKETRKALDRAKAKVGKALAKKPKAKARPKKADKKAAPKKSVAKKAKAKKTAAPRKAVKKTMKRRGKKK